MSNAHAYGRGHGGRIRALWLFLVIVFTAGSVPATSPDRLAEWLYATAKKLPHSAAPGETPEAYDDRLRGMMRAVAASTKPYANGQGWTATELALAEVETWHGETLFDQRIHAGLAHPKWNSDQGRAKCFGQIHISVLVPKDQWEQLVGTDAESTQMCADATARMLVAMARQCGVWSGQRADRTKVAKVFAAYASGGKCVPQERDWARADKWNAAISQRPDRSPVRGFRRAGLGELNDLVLEESNRIVSMLGLSPDVKPGTVFEFGPSYKLLVEKHTNQKIGVSVFVKE